MDSYLGILVILAGFTVITLAAKQVGGFFIKANLPLISGFLFTGIVAGPHVLGLISEEATENLRFVDEISLAFIAFAAGSELYMKELRSRLTSIRWVTFGLVVSTFVIGSGAVFMLSALIPFMRAMPTTSRIAISVLGGAILVARSPSSAIAIVNELRAKGPFTKTVLGVTVIMDVVVIALFAINSSIADALLTGLSVDLGFVVLLAGELSMSLVIGYALGKVLQYILSSAAKRAVKTSLILLAGYGVFVLSGFIRDITHDRLPFEVLFEPLLICMIGSFLTTNFSDYRKEFSNILHNMGLPIYIAFFTLTGASLALDILIETWPIVLALFFVRLAGIFVGSFGGGLISREPMEHNRIAWMAYITQAGVALGLAKDVVVEFPEWGASFATIIIAVIVVNQIVGPPFFKWAIHLVGEARPRADTPDFDGTRDAIIFGLEGQSLALARLLQSHGWQVKVAATQFGYVEGMGQGSNVDIRPIPALTLDTLNQLDAGGAEAIVMMLSDEENYRVCELAYENFGTENLVVRVRDPANANHFRKLGALVVDPTTAMVGLLDHFVRSPSAASLLLGMESNQDVLDLEVRNPDLHGMALRDLRLPLDVVILSVRRRGQMLASHGFTRLEVGDWVTVVGSLSSLEQMMLRLDADREDEMIDLVGRVTPSELTTRSLETEVKGIIREKDEVRKDRFDEFIQKSVVIDIEHAMEMQEFFLLVAGTMSAKLNKDRDTLYQLLMEREKKASTAISPGLAIPHIIIDGKHMFSILLARCREGIAFSESTIPVKAVFVLIGTVDERDFHLRALSTIAEIVQDPSFDRRWMRARSEQALRDVVLRGREKRRK